MGAGSHCCPGEGQAPHQGRQNTVHQSRQTIHPHQQLRIQITNNIVVNSIMNNKRLLKIYCLPEVSLFPERPSELSSKTADEEAARVPRMASISS